MIVQITWAGILALSLAVGGLGSEASMTYPGADVSGVEDVAADTIPARPSSEVIRAESLLDASGDEVTSDIAEGAEAFPAAQEYPSFSPRGRLHTDAVFMDEENVDAANTAFVRRARLGVSGDLAPAWGFQIEFDFGEDGVSTNDVFLERALPVGSVRIGQTKVPFSMNELTSSNRIAFIERASPSNAFADARRLGANYAHFGERLGLQAMAYTRAIGDAHELPLGTAGRLTAFPRFGPEHVFHAGISGAFENLDRSEAVQFRDRPEGRVGGGALRLASVGIDSDVNSTFKAGLETGYQNGPFTAEAEYFRTSVNRAAGPEPTFDGFYAQGTYTLTGESRGYSGGGFRSVSPTGRLGAWEIGARFSHVNLNDGDFRGGEQNNLTLALNWTASANVRLMANFVRVDVKESDQVLALTDGLTDRDSPNLFVFRTQFSF